MHSGMAGTTAQHGLLHDDAALTQADRAILGGEHGTEQDAAVGTDLDVAAQHGGRSDIGGSGDAGTRAFVLDQHASSLPETFSTQRAPEARGRPGLGVGGGACRAVSRRQARPSRRR